jgi:S1-C subfamily serine protease
MLSTSQIASRTDPGLADVVSTDSYQQAAAVGTGIVLTSAGQVLTNNHVRTDLDMAHRAMTMWPCVGKS